eukprot:287311_1
MLQLPQSAVVSHETRFKVQWIDNDTILYNFYKYSTAQYQANNLRVNEISFRCSTQKCGHPIRIQMQHDGQWRCSFYRQFDGESVKAHDLSIRHTYTLFTPDRQHIENMREVARQDVLLHHTSSRTASENQFLQNPNAAKMESVLTFKRRMGSIQSDFLTEYLQYPPAPQTALGAALSLNRYPIWKMNIWAHSSHALHQYLKQHN